MPLTQVDQGLLSSTAQYTGFKNRIINGAMTFAQRATTFSGVGGSAYQTLDRFVLDTRINGSPTGSYTQAQSTDAPAGFNNSFSVTVSTAGNSLASSGALQWNQFIEGYNVADFAWGTASAQPVTISFWVKASITGVYSFGVVNAGYDRSYVANYTVNSANTWEYKTITIPGCPDGTWNTTTGRGIQLRFSLGTGSNYVTSSPNTWLTAEYEQSSTASASAAFWSTTGATWRITGVQLEKGSTATSFDYRPYGTELSLCQRYWERIGYGSDIVIGGYQVTNGLIYVSFSHAVPKRNPPTVLKLGTWTVSSSTQPTVSSPTTWGFRVYITANATGTIYALNDSPSLYFSSDAEL